VTTEQVDTTAGRETWALRLLVSIQQKVHLLLFSFMASSVTKCEHRITQPLIFIRSYSNYTTTCFGQIVGYHRFFMFELPCIISLYYIKDQQDATLAACLLVTAR
jgi:hypothetical protein